MKDILLILFFGLSILCLLYWFMFVFASKKP